MTTYLVTGANRGLGLALVANLAPRPNTVVFAAARSSSPELKTLVENSSGRVLSIHVEVTKPASIATAVEAVQKHTESLDVLINNVGTQTYTPGGTPAMEDLSEVLDVNVISVHHMTAAFLPLLRKGKEKKVINITSTLGSIAMAPTFTLAPVPGYKISKAALNMLTVQYANDLGKEGFTFIPISPGYLKTDLGSAGADLEVDVGAAAVVDIITKADHTFNGKFQNIHADGWEHADDAHKYDGKSPPW